MRSEHSDLSNAFLFSNRNLQVEVKQGTFKARMRQPPHKIGADNDGTRERHRIVSIQRGSVEQ